MSMSISFPIKHLANTEVRNSYCKMSFFYSDISEVKMSNPHIWKAGIFAW